MRDPQNMTIIDLNADTRLESKEGQRISAYLHKRSASADATSIIVRATHRKRYDIGAWCFTGPKTFTIPKIVDISQYRPERTRPLMNLVREIITMACTTKTPSGACSKLADFAVMIDFSDNNGHVNFLASPEDYHLALSHFTNHLESSGRKAVTKAKLQSVTIEIGSYLFPESQIIFSAGIERLQSVPVKGASTKPPPELPVKRFHNVFSSIFGELTKFVLDGNAFPFPIEIDGERAVLTTEAYPFLTDSMAKNKKDAGQKSPFIDYTTGLCRTFGEAYARIPNAIYSRYSYFRSKSAKGLELGNSETYCHRRIRLQKLAHDSFVTLFAINTGANESSLIAAPWQGHYDVRKGKNGERIISIKLRGGLQVVEFSVKTPFVKKFEEYLKLRKHILNGEEHPFLFIGFDYRKISEFRQLDENAIKNLSVQIQKMVDPEFPIIGYRQLRAFKDAWVVKEYGAKTSAALLHHSSATQHKHYNNIEEKEAVDRIVLALGTIVGSLGEQGTTLQTPPGACTGAAPTSATDIPEGYEPDCKNGRGCLFCDEFRTTVEPSSIHKLISMQYVISKFIHTCDDLSHFKKIHQPALDVIDKLLSKIREIHPASERDLRDIHELVYTKLELTEYWEKYLSRFIKIGALR